MADYLPQAFQEEMARLFADFSLMEEWSDFLASFRQDSARALRANQQKISSGQLHRLLQTSSGLGGSAFPAVPWAEGGFYYPAGFAPGQLPFYLAGLYYIQEPSAMFPAQVLAARPGEKVLDLCAAPGGKAVKISADLAGQGLLWANEISGKRARALKHNLELAGARNALVTQEAPGQLASQLAGAFDAIMADVPCSASAMFRRTASAVRNWPLHQADYPAVQKEILLAAWQMLRPGGRLVYATCSFSLAENEEMIAWFCRQQPDCQILPIDKPAGVSDGLPVNNELRKTARIWPHLSAADGHFCALLQKKGEQKAALPSKTVPAGDGPAWQAFLDFCRTSLSRQGQHRLRQLYLESQKTARNGHLHLLPAFQLPHELKYLMPGLYLGQVRQDKRSWRFLPSFTLLLSCDCQDLARLVPAPAKSELIRRCLGGQSLVLPENLVQQKWPSGQRVAVALAEEQGCWPLSWARLAENGLLKNDLPAFLVR